MTNFGSINTSASALRVFRTWMDAVSDNVANSETARRTSDTAFQARYVEATALEGANGTGTGVAVKSIQLGDPVGRLVYDPASPLADADGMVRYPDIDMGDQLTQMMVAQRGYQANLQVVDRARDTYLQALRIGH
ncbi:MAG: flagellar basal-body rod protein FlgC [Actinomycetia bacterium]|nr:flagellar basal-body rod protein FlgC [Actinomycetes bacterium]